VRRCGLLDAVFSASGSLVGTFLRRAPEIGMAPLARMTNELTALSTSATNACLRRGLPGGAAWGRRTMMYSEWAETTRKREKCGTMRRAAMMVVRRVVRRSHLFRESERPGEQNHRCGKSSNNYRSHRHSSSRAPAAIGAIGADDVGRYERLPLRRMHVEAKAERGNDAHQGRKFGVYHHCRGRGRAPRA
jgi:hypothetical protein